MKLSFNTFDYEREAARCAQIASMTLMSLFLAGNWILNGPDMSSFWLVAEATFLRRRNGFDVEFLRGTAMLASPECYAGIFDMPDGGGRS